MCFATCVCESCDLCGRRKGWIAKHRPQFPVREARGAWRAGRTGAVRETSPRTLSVRVSLWTLVVLARRTCSRETPAPAPGSRPATASTPSTRLCARTWRSISTPSTQRLFEGARVDRHVVDATSAGGRASDSRVDAQTGPARPSRQTATARHRTRATNESWRGSGWSRLDGRPGHDAGPGSVRHVSRRRREDARRRGDRRGGVASTSDFGVTGPAQPSLH